jgi:hypothetical protein
MSIPYPSSPVLDQAYTYEGEDTYIWSGTAWEIVLTFPATPTPREAYKYEENEKVYVWTSGTEANNWQPGWRLVSTFPAVPEIDEVHTYEGYSYVWGGASWTLKGYYEPATNISSRSQDDENRLVNKALTRFPVPHLSGLKLEADIRLGNLVLNTIDEAGVVWICTDIEGWWEFPDPELPSLVRGWGDGSYDARGRWNSRMITLKGTFLTQDPSQVPAARAKLIEAADLVYEGGLLIVNEEPAKSAFVRLSDSPDIKTVTPRGRTEFSLGLRAADPIKYEYVEVSINGDGYRTQVLTPSSSGSANATLTNLGNIEVPILIELSQGFTILAPDGPEAGATLVPVRFYQRTEDAITIQFFAAHPFQDGDIVYLDNVHPTMDGYHTVYVADVHDSGDTLQIISPGAPVFFTTGASNASVSAASAPVNPARITNTETDQVISIVGSTAATNRLEIDTYNREVLDVRYDSGQVVEVSSGRSKISTLSDWIYLAPGENTIAISDFPAGSSCTIYYRSGWIA